jgi:hypothetical protein
MSEDCQSKQKHMNARRGTEHPSSFIQKWMGYTSLSTTSIYLNADIAAMA